MHNHVDGVVVVVRESIVLVLKYVLAFLASFVISKILSTASTDAFPA